MISCTRLRQKKKDHKMAHQSRRSWLHLNLKRHECEKKKKGGGGTQLNFRKARAVHRGRGEKKINIFLPELQNS